MDGRDIIDDMMLNQGNFDSLIDLLVISIIELDKDTMNSRDRNKIIRFIGQFNVLLQGMARENKEIYKKCNELYKVIVELEAK